MRYEHLLTSPLAVLMLLLAGNAAIAKEKLLERETIPKVIDFTETDKPGDVEPRQAWFDVSKAQLFQDHAVDLIKATMGLCHGYQADGTVTVHNCEKEFDKSGKPTGKNESPNFPGRRDYIIIHIVTWKDAAAGAKAPEVDKQNWYVYNSDPNWDQASFAANNRIFGSKSVYLLYVHFNRPAKMAYNMRYLMDVQSKIPAFLDHLIKLGQLFGMQVTGGGGPTDEVADVWGAMNFDIPYLPSDVTVTPELLPTQGGAPLLTMDAKKFDNEGKYHLDFSVGVPITKITEFSYVSASNTLVPAKVDKQKLFALFNIYPRAVDVKTQIWSWYPSIVTGVGVGSKPLQKALFGVGWGPLLANFYVGLLLNTSPLPEGTSCGSTPTVDQLKGKLSNKTCPAFSFGLNVAVGSILDTLKSKASSASGGK